jgi:hypothetical protein
MRLAPLICCLSTAAALALVGQAAQAQDLYNPAPVMSPWFNLFNKNPGPLGNYQSYVRPQLQLQNTIQQQNNGMFQQGVDIQQGNARLNLLGNQVGQLQRGGGLLPPTGHAAGFMYYSHYYGYQTTGTGLGALQRTMPSRGTAGATAMPFRGTTGITSMPGLMGMPGGVQ